MKILTKKTYLVASVVFGFFILGYSVAWVTNKPANAKGNSHYCKKDDEGPACESLWERTSDDPVAFFTFWLVVVTGGLVGGTLIQMRFLIRADQTARKAANAADLSAKAAISVELPALVLHKLRFYHPIRQINTELRWWALLHDQKVEIEVKNYGRTPAFVVSQAVELKVGELAENPDYSRTARDLDLGTVIESKEVYGLGMARGGKLYSREEVDDIREGRKILWAFGYIQYRDFLNEPHVLRFCRELIPLSSVNGTHRWIDSGPEHYSESF